MLKSILNHLESVLPSENLHVEADRWPSIRQSFATELEQIINQLFGTVSLTFPKRLHSESKFEFITNTQPSVVVAEFRLRPKSEYFTRTGRRLPQPEDQQGPHATGIEVSIVVCRGYPTGRLIRQPFLSVDFRVWGHHERECFGKLLRDHRYIIEKLVSSSPATFFTSCVFDNLEQKKRKSTFDKLCLYYENTVDEENIFSLQSEFGQDATEAKIIAALLPMVAIYDSAMGYCLPKKSRGRVLEYLALI